MNPLASAPKWTVLLRAGARRMAAVLRPFGLVPAGRPAPSWQTLRPRGSLQWATCIVLWAVFGLYVSSWFGAHGGYLFDPLLQQDDTRTLAPLHRWSEPGTFENDAVARGSAAVVTPGVYVLYRVLVPLTGLASASKLVQLLALCILLGAGWILVRSRRVGLAGALLLVFLLLHTPIVPLRMAGGLPRGFAFPLAAVWAAGALARSERARFAAAGSGALLYPPIMLLLLAAEAVYGLMPPHSMATIRWARRFVFLALLCGIMVGGYARITGESGRLHTLAEARAEPAFGPEGRLKVLPFQEPVGYSAWGLAAPFLPVRQPGYDTPLTQRLGSTNAILAVSALLLVGALGVGGSARVTVALICAAAGMYAIARVMAFRFYSPVRYVDYGMPLASMLLAVSVVGGLLPALRPRRLRQAARNAAAAALIGGLWLVNGDGVPRPNEGMTVDGRVNGGLYAFVAELPRDARIAAHPGDADNAAYWGARSTTDGYDTMVPWFIDGWDRQKKRTEETLAALYTANQTYLLDYCRERDVTHILVRRDRYEPDDLTVGLFEPFVTFLDEHLADREPESMVLRSPPEAAVVFEDGPYALIDVDHLAVVWGEQAVTEVVPQPDP